MTFGGFLMSIFPLLQGLSILISALLFITEKNFLWLGAVLFCIYLLPVLLFRVHSLFLPLREGAFNLAEKKYNVWWASYQFQFIFISFPFLEVPLHFVPGAYSYWLRLWGSKVGKNVFWTPRVEILDRALLDIGSNVIIGHLAIFSSHAITPSKNKLLLVVKKITLGEGSFVGADSQFGPGAVTQPGEVVKAKTVRYWKAENK